MKFIFIEKVIYSDGVSNVYEHEIKASSLTDANKEAQKILEKTKLLIGSAGRCFFVALRPV